MIPLHTGFIRAGGEPSREIAIPTIHFVETAAGYNVTIRKEQKPWRRNRAYFGLPRMPNDNWQVFNAYLAGLFELLHGIRFGKAGWQIEQGRLWQLWIHDTVATCHGAGKHIPIRSDVVQDRAEASVGLRRGWAREVGEDNQEN